MQVIVPHVLPACWCHTHTPRTQWVMHRLEAGIKDPPCSQVGLLEGAILRTPLPPSNDGQVGGCGAGRTAVGFAEWFIDWLVD
jgi:hypothetical protein